LVVVFSADKDLPRVSEVAAWTVVWFFCFLVRTLLSS
jgi:hypothetical protein